MKDPFTCSSGPQPSDRDAQHGVDAAVEGEVEGGDQRDADSVCAAGAVGVRPTRALGRLAGSGRRSRARRRRAAPTSSFDLDDGSIGSSPGAPYDRPLTSWRLTLRACDRAAGSPHPTVGSSQLLDRAANRRRPMPVSLLVVAATLRAQSMSCIVTLRATHGGRLFRFEATQCADSGFW